MVKYSDNMTMRMVSEYRHNALGHYASRYRIYNGGICQYDLHGYTGNTIRKFLRDDSVISVKFY